MGKPLGELFDPKQELVIEERLRPHWSQAGAIVFVTFRTADSIPQEVIRRWEREKTEWMRQHGYSADKHWSKLLAILPEQQLAEFHRQFNRSKEMFLDSCHGACRLKETELASIVADALIYFDGERYRLGDFVVMPNHVHALVAFADPKAMRKQFDSWLHFTARQINLRIRSRGHFWQQEPFDHLVRSPEQYGYLVKYIADNPRKANLKPGEYHYRKYNT